MNNNLIFRCKEHTLKVEPWGKSSVRVRATPTAEFNLNSPALLTAKACNVEITSTENSQILVNGDLKVELDNSGRLSFFNSKTNKLLFQEPEVEILHPAAREFKFLNGNRYEIECRFNAQEDEQFFGLGQHRHGRFDQKGCVLDLRQENCEMSIPFMVSNRGYGFLWHNPAIGRVELGHTLTRWISNSSTEIDYWVTASNNPNEIMENYATATGFAPKFPYWASGFWQSKLRYKTQDELLEVAREYKRRNLPISVIVIDFFHWTMMGDFTFEEKDWPNPEELVAELKAMDIEVMVSVWPSLNINSKNYDDFCDNGYLVQNGGGGLLSCRFMDTKPEGKSDLNFYDTTNPEARKLFWQKARDTYYKQGFKIFWLDCCEPQVDRSDYNNAKYYGGDAMSVASLYPFYQEEAFYTGMQNEGQKEILNLCRSAWAGSQRFGAAVWSGDIKSTFEVLTGQVKAGLNMAMSGMPWWNTDIGGFHSGDTTTEYFRELIVRWFQYGVFCPIFRLHGVREPVVTHVDGGMPNEVWCFGEEAYNIIIKLMELRERLRPYIMAGMEESSSNGKPLMRPLFLEFPNDEKSWKIDDQFMFGSDILVSPVTKQGEIERIVYLPADEVWIDAWSGEEFAGGNTLNVSAPLAKIPVFVRKSSNLNLATIFNGIL